MDDDLVNLKKDNSKSLVKVWDLILDINKHPFTGIGKPEALKGDLQGWWSRRITAKNILTYRIEEYILKIMSCHGHYKDK
jgi:toxin YoeB